MTTEITRKQAILLTILGVVLVVICFVQFLIRPMLTEASKTKEQIEALTQQYETLVQQSQSYDQNMEALEGWKEKNSGETDKLFPLCDSERIDRFLNFVMHECGVKVTSLSIGELMEYYVDGEGSLIAANPEIVEAAVSENSEAASETAAEDAAAASYTATGEYRCDFTYIIEGNYENMVQMLNFVDGVSFLGVSSYSFNTIEDTSTENSESDAEEEKGFDDLYSFTMIISAYMYESPLQTEEDASEEESTENSSTEEESSAAASA